MHWMTKMGLAVAISTLAACTAEKTQEGEMPDVDVNAEGGQLPKYDVDPATVEVGTDTTKVVTPDVDIKPAESTTTN